VALEREAALEKALPQLEARYAREHRAQQALGETGVFSAGAA